MAVTAPSMGCAASATSARASSPPPPWGRGAADAPSPKAQSSVEGAPAAFSNPEWRGRMALPRRKTVLLERECHPAPRPHGEWVEGEAGEGWGGRAPAFGVETPAPTPSNPRTRWRMLSSVLTGMNLRIESVSPPPRWMKPQEGDDEVDGAEPERVCAGSVAGDEQAERPGEDVDDVVPAVDREHAEDIVGLQRVPGVEAGVVEEPDDPRHDQRAADKGGVEPCWA